MRVPSAEALAWLLLLEDGRLLRNHGNKRAFDDAVQTGWGISTVRQNEIFLSAGYGPDIEARLDRLWPAWREGRAALRAAGLNSTPASWRTLADARRRQELAPGLPGSLNQRSAAAALRDHSKAGLGELELAALGETVVTHDNLIRIRPHPGLTLSSGAQTIDGAQLAAICGEVCVTDRAFKTGTRLQGRPPVAILLVENLGVYVDVPLPAGWCAVHVPGWNLRMVSVLREAWPETPALIFGDLDPNGVAIARSLQVAWPGLGWFIPRFAVEYLGRALRREWAEVPSDAPELVKVLAERGMWVEQEVFVLDGRLRGELEGFLRDRGGS